MLVFNLRVFAAWFIDVLRGSRGVKFSESCKKLKNSLKTLRLSGFALFVKPNYSTQGFWGAAFEAGKLIAR
jgi:hypothetical protein